VERATSRSSGRSLWFSAPGAGRDRRPPSFRETFTLGRALVLAAEVRLQGPQEVLHVHGEHPRDQLSSYLQRAERGERIVVLRAGRPVAALVPLSHQLPEATEEQRLAELESRGLVTLPRRTKRGFQGPAFPDRGKLASEMISEDRR